MNPLCLHSCQVPGYQLTVSPPRPGPCSGSGAVLGNKCLIRVGISVTFCLTSHPSRRQPNIGEQASQNKMFTFIKSIVVSRVLPIFTGKNERFWEFLKRVEI